MQAYIGGALLEVTLLPLHLSDMIFETQLDFKNWLLFDIAALRCEPSESIEASFESK